jgi:serine/threonine-protein kinase
MKKIGKYRILHVLGKGGMGIVYKAFDPLMEREVAIKVLSEQLFDEPEIKERFYREARSAGKLSHENITIVHDLGEVDGKPFIVMEYLTGTDLRSIVKQKQPLTLLQKLDYARQIAKGLAYSHSKNIIHRDIKPENIRILDDGKAKIMDFGIARPTTSTMTRTGTVMGTPHYMSPEQIKGQVVDRQSDIFSFGVVLYELLTYRRPFEGDSPTTVSYKIVHEKFEPLHDWEIEHIPAIRNIVLKCLQKDKAKRYQSISDVAADLDEAMELLQAREKKTFDANKRKVENLLAKSHESLKREDFRRARELAQKAAQIADQEMPTLRRDVDELLAEIDTQQRAKIDVLLTSGEEYLSKKDFGRASKIAKEILKLSSDHAEALRLLKRTEEMRAVVEAEGRTILLGRAAELLLVKEQLKRKPSSRLSVNRKALVLSIAGLLMVSLLFYRIVIYVPEPPIGYVALNILPWAEITKVVDQASQKAVKLDGNANRLVTPCRLSLPVGTYTIYLKNSIYQDSLTLSVDVKAGEVKEIREKIPAFNYMTIFSELDSD